MQQSVKNPVEQAILPTIMNYEEKSILPLELFRKIGQQGFLEEEIDVAIVLKPSRTLCHEEIVTGCEPRLPKFLIPRYIEFMEKLPKSASEKVQKGVLKERGLTPATWDRHKQSGT